MNELLQKPFWNFEPPLDICGRTIPESDREVLRSIMEEHGCDTVDWKGFGINAVYNIGSATTGLTVKITGQSDDISDLVPAERESQALPFLAEFADPPLDIPELVHYNAETGLRVMTTLPGYSETLTGFWEFGRRSGARIIGRKVGQWNGWLGNIDPDTFRQHITNPYSDWDGALLRTVGSFEDRENNPVLTQLGQEVLKKHFEYFPDGSRALDNRPVHDDLRYSNLMFGSPGAPTGAIDFEVLILGDPARPMRHFYTPDGVMLEACIEAYQETTGDTSIDVQRVAHWAKAQAFATICNQLQKPRPNLDRVVGAQGWLTRLYPNVDWTELSVAVIRRFKPKTGDWDSTYFVGYSEVAASMPPQPQARHTLTNDEEMALLYNPAVLL